MRINSLPPVNSNQKTNIWGNQPKFGVIMKGDKVFHGESEKKFLEGILEQADNFKFLISNPKWGVESEFQVAGKAKVIDLVEGPLTGLKLVIRRPKEEDYTIFGDGMSRESFGIFVKIHDKLTNLIPKKYEFDQF